MWEKEDVPVEGKNENKDENEYICGLRWELIVKKKKKINGESGDSL